MRKRRCGDICYFTIERGEGAITKLLPVFLVIHLVKGTQVEWAGTLAPPPPTLSFKRNIVSVAEGSLLKVALRDIVPCETFF